MWTSCPVGVSVIDKNLLLSSEGDVLAKYTGEKVVVVRDKPYRIRSPTKVSLVAASCAIRSMSLIRMWPPWPPWPRKVVVVFAPDGRGGLRRASEMAKTQ